jgi:hypothetical protein
LTSAWIQLPLPGCAITVSFGFTTVIGPVEAPSSLSVPPEPVAAPEKVATPT